MKYYERIMQIIDGWNNSLKQAKEAAEQVNANRSLSAFGKMEKIQILERALEDERQKALRNWETEWKSFKEYCTVKENNANSTERTAAMQSIVAVGEAMTGSMLETILSPIQKDAGALRLVKPLIERQGLLEMFKKTNSYKFLDAANKTESFSKEAEEYSRALLAEEDSFRFGIRKHYMSSCLEQAEKYADILHELEG